jgi:two-component sensor histidine kinase/PAS domain-containing protein
LTKAQFARMTGLLGRRASGTGSALTKATIMTSDEDFSDKSRPESQQVGQLFDYAELADAIETEDFKRLLDNIPIAVLISKDVRGVHRIIYANSAFESLVGQTLDDVRRHVGSILDALKHEDEPTLTLRMALQEGRQFVGAFQLDWPKPLIVEAYSNLIENDDGSENYRIFALLDVTSRTRAQREEFSRRLRDKEVLLLELQHRVRNNLQLITAMIRLEARNKRDGEPVNLDRLAGRIESLQLLYRDLSPENWGNAVDLGHYLSQIASAVMHAYAVDGIRLDLKVDHAMASINVAMPIGLIVNELLTNAFKYAFTARETGTITVRCLHEDDINYRIVVADDGNGLPDGITWPMPGKLGALVMQALRENAKNVEASVETAPGSGTQVTITFQHKPSLPKLQ